MRFYKVMLVSIISIITLSLILVIAYNTRLTIISYLAEEQLSAQQIKITCLDLDLTDDMSIVVSDLCIQSPKADIEIKNILVQWQFSPELTVTNIDVNLIKIIGTDHLLEKNQNSEPSETKKLSELLSKTIKPYAEQIAQVKLPLTFNINQLAYYPFSIKGKENTSQDKTPPVKPYLASLSGTNNTVKLSLLTPRKVEFINTRFTTTEKGFTIGLLSNLMLLKDLASIHQLPITTELQSTLNNIDLSGSLNTKITYQAETLTLQTQLNNLTVSSTTGVAKSGPFTLASSLNFQTQLTLTDQIDNDVLISTTFSPSKSFAKNELTLDYSQQHLIPLLQEKRVSSEVIALLNDNPTDRLTMEFKDNKQRGSKKNNQDDSTNTEQVTEQFTMRDKATIVLNDKQVNLSDLQISASTNNNKNTALVNKPVHQIKFEEVLFKFPIPNQTSTSIQPKGTLAIEHFSIDSQVTLTNIAAFTKEPVDVYLSGSFYKAEQQIDLNLSDNSRITAKNFVMSKEKVKDCLLYTSPSPRD